MLLAVVARPIAEHDFDSKIFHKKISREEEYKRATTTERFCNSAALNGHLWGGGWLNLITSSMALGDFKDAIQEQYPVIDNEIISCLVFRHYKHVGSKDVTKKAVYITDDNEPLPGKVQMETGGYKLMV